MNAPRAWLLPSRRANSSDLETARNPAPALLVLRLDAHVEDLPHPRVVERNDQSPRLVDLLVFACHRTPEPDSSGLKPDLAGVLVLSGDIDVDIGLIVSCATRIRRKEGDERHVGRRLVSGVTTLVELFVILPVMLVLEFVIGPTSVLVNT